MTNPIPLAAEQVLGRKIRRVVHHNLPYDPEHKFQPRLVIVELDSGVLFSLEQNSDIIQADSRTGFVYPCPTMPDHIECVLDSATEPALASPVQGLVVPFAWNDRVGVLLQNGFLLHDGFSSWENGALFYLPDERTRAQMLSIELPKRATR